MRISDKIIVSKSVISEIFCSKRNNKPLSMPIYTIITVKMCDFVWCSCFDRVFGIFNILRLKKSSETLQWKCIALDRLHRCDKSIFRNNLNISTAVVICCFLFWFQLVSDVLRIELNIIWKECEHHFVRMVQKWTKQQREKEGRKKNWEQANSESNTNSNQMNIEYAIGSIKCLFLW